MGNAEPSSSRQLHSAESDGRHRLVLFLSLGLNVGLFLFLASNFWRPEAPPVSRLPDKTPRASGRSLRADAKPVFVRAAVPSAWDQVASTDLAVYAANLHGAGCPRKTVRDILLPLIEEQFKQSGRSALEPTNFWASFSQRQAVALAGAEQDLALREQKDQMLKSLLGFVWSSGGLKQAYTGEAAGTVGFLEYNRAEKLLCIADRLKEPFSIVNRTPRLEHRSAVYQAWRQELDQVLSPAEFEETELRGLLLVWQRRTPNLCNAGLSGPEMRQLMAFRREMCKPLPSALLAGGDELLGESDWTREQQFLTKTRGLLGDIRFVDYLKNTDPSIEKTVATLKKVNLPRSLVLQLFDLRQEAIARAQEIRQFPLRRAEKRAQLSALRQDVLEQLATLPNAAPESPLLEVHRDWLQEIGNP